MSDTVNVTIITEDWTEVIDTGEGFITNESDNIIKYQEAEVKPDITDQGGHTLQRRDYVRYELTLPFKVWARAVYAGNTIGAPLLIVVTPD